MWIPIRTCTGLSWSERWARGCGERVPGARECGEEGVTLGAELDPVVGGESLPQYSSVLPKRLVEALLAELLEKPGRGLDVGEEEGDGSARERLHFR